MSNPFIPNSDTKPSFSVDKSTEKNKPSPGMFTFGSNNKTDAGPDKSIDPLTPFMKMNTNTNPNNEFSLGLGKDQNTTNNPFINPTPLKPGFLLSNLSGNTPAPGFSFTPAPELVKNYSGNAFTEGLKKEESSKIFQWSSNSYLKSENPINPPDAPIKPAGNFNSFIGDGLKNEKSTSGMPTFNSTQSSNLKSNLFQGSNPTSNLFQGSNPTSGLFQASNSTSSLFQAPNPTSSLFQASNPSSSLFQASNPTSNLFQASNPKSNIFQPSNPTSSLFQQANPKPGSFQNSELSPSSNTPTPSLLKCSNPTSNLFQNSDLPTSNNSSAPSLLQGSNPPTSIYSQSSNLFQGPNASSSLFKSPNLTPSLFQGSSLSQSPDPKLSLFQGSNPPPSAYNQPSSLFQGSSLSQGPNPKPNPPPSAYNQPSSLFQGSSLSQGSNPKPYPPPSAYNQPSSLFQGPNASSGLFQGSNSPSSSYLKHHLDYKDNLTQAADKNYKLLNDLTQKTLAIQANISSLAEKNDENNITIEKNHKNILDLKSQIEQQENTLKNLNENIKNLEIEVENTLPKHGCYKKKINHELVPKSLKEKILFLESQLEKKREACSTGIQKLENKFYKKLTHYNEKLQQIKDNISTKEKQLEKSIKFKAIQRLKFKSPQESLSEPEQESEMLSTLFESTPVRPKQFEIPYTEVLLLLLGMLVSFITLNYF
jgi:hypothetical protein